MLITGCHRVEQTKNDSDSKTITMAIKDIYHAIEYANIDTLSYKCIISNSYKDSLDLRRYPWNINDSCHCTMTSIAEKYKAEIGDNHEIDSATLGSKFDVLSQDDINSLVRQDIHVGYFHLSKPIYSDNLCIIDIDYNKIGISRGYTYILNRSGDKWLIKMKFVRWFE